MPPSRTPTARAVIGTLKRLWRKSAQKIMLRLRKTVEMAGVKKCRTVLRIPMQSATRLTKKM